MDSGEQSQLPEDYEGEDGMDSAPKHTGHEDDPTERQLQLEVCASIINDVSVLICLQTPRWASNKPENASGSRFRPRPQESGSESSDSQPSKPPTQMTTKNRRQGSAKQVPKSSKRAVATAKSEVSVFIAEAMQLGLTTRIFRRQAGRCSLMTQMKISNPL